MELDIAMIICWSSILPEFTGHDGSEATMISREDATQ
jgi:hypothetical protein